jgi:SAM-dependent methyltransferase
VDFLDRTRAAYDTVAAAYAGTVPARHAQIPAARAVLGWYAELVDGPVLEVGCGPGHVTADLAARGVDAAGLDLSPAMVAQARRAHPGLRFDVGSMTDLHGSYGGLVAWYSLIHIPPGLRPQVLAGFARVLRPGGRLLLAFQTGDELRHITEGYGHTGLDLDTYRLPPATVAAELATAGIPVTATLVCAPESGETVPQAYLLARRDNPGLS